MRTTCTISAPTKVRQTEPTPPVIAVPPTTIEAMAGSRNSLASVGEPEPSRAAMTTPAIAGHGARQRVGGDLDAVDVDAGSDHRALLRADAAHEAAEGRQLQQDAQQHQHD